MVDSITGASKCGYGHRTGKSDPCSQGEEKADRRDGAGQISELEWNGNVCFRRIDCILMREYCIIKTMQGRKTPLHSFYF